MEIRRVNDDFAVAGQIGPEDIGAIAAEGFRSIVCNRPDTEDGAIPHDAVEEAARAAGLEFRFLPVVSGAITDDDVQQMSELLASLPAPILAYCRTGNRCLNLFAMVQNSR
ncbi:TIGR01244 family sulfur transferase [Chelativorans composti]|jgi:TIGR01244 family protein|uniref:TIGR01244 family sulfur transferase n=1 Tax=Chelativorans composti TaxID=768533 RepID=A0ABW5DCY9_9HYPH